MTQTKPTKQRKGFRCMPKWKQREIQKKGGQAIAAKKGRMKFLGRLGGTASAKAKKARKKAQ